MQLTKHDSYGTWTFALALDRIALPVLAMLSAVSIPVHLRRLSSQIRRLCTTTAKGLTALSTDSCGEPGAEGRSPGS